MPGPGGRRPGAGRKSLRDEERYQDMVREIWGPRMPEVLEALVVLALDKGAYAPARVNAAKEILARMVGPVPPAPRPEGAPGNGVAPVQIILSPAEHDAI